MGLVSACSLALLGYECPILRRDLWPAPSPTSPPTYCSLVAVQRLHMIGLPDGREIFASEVLYMPTGYVQPDQRRGMV